MKVFLAGHEGRYNRGCEAIVYATQAMLRDRLKNPDFVLSSFHHADDAKADWGGDLSIIPAKSTALWEKYSPDWFMAKLYRRISQEKEWELILKPLHKGLAASDVVLSVGGDNYTDDYVDYHDPLRYYLKLNHLVKSFKKKLVIWGASVGPFKKQERIKYVVECLNLADLLTIRESWSFKYLQEIGVHNIRRVADPAFLLSTETVDDPVLDVMKDYEFLGFNISPLIAAYLSDRGKDYVVNACARFLDEVLSLRDIRVLLVPHVLSDIPAHNDRLFMGAVKLRMKNASRCHLPVQDHNSRQLKYLIAKCRYFMGARTHATIAALSTGVPTISIGYSQKALGINEDVFGSSDFVLDYKNLSAASLRERFDSLVSRGSDIRQYLAKVMPGIKELAWKNAEYLKELLDGAQV